jgi:hypothetical protein
VEEQRNEPNRDLSVLEVFELHYIEDLQNALPTCAISIGYMTDPVYHIVYGAPQIFDRVNILRWLPGHNTCPITRTPLTQAMLLPDNALKAATAALCIMERGELRLVTQEEWIADTARRQALMKKEFLLAAAKGYEELKKFSGHIPHYFEHCHPQSNPRRMTLLHIAAHHPGRRR